MADWITPWVLDTHKYNPDYAHLDKGHDAPWQYRELSQRVKWEDSFDGGVSIERRVKINKTLTAEQVYKGLADELREGCSCEYDCCGHLHGGLHDVERPHNHKKMNGY